MSWKQKVTAKYLSKFRKRNNKGRFLVDKTSEGWIHIDNIIFTEKLDPHGIKALYNGLDRIEKEIGMLKAYMRGRYIL